MKLLYLAGPYRAPLPYLVEQNVLVAQGVQAALVRMGYAVLCPHSNYHPIAGVVDEQGFLERDLVALGRCDGIVLLPGWEQSEGSRVEKMTAEVCRLPVYFWPNDAAVLEGGAE